ncbi:MAG TPA: glycosyltransferase family 1 protein [Candidatus Saccharimonadales bacterium]|nr:glycosyltransferase family 1 protein [Candidatus Saccharimonadales bacterium]
MSRIVIDGRQWNSTTGRYVRNLVSGLESLDKSNDYKVLLFPEDLPSWQSSAPNFEAVICRHREGTLAEQLGLKKQLDSLGPDLVHFPMVQQPARYRGKVVTTMNDLTTLRFRNPTKNQLVMLFKQKVYLWLNKRVVRKSDALLTYSEFVKHDIVKHLGADPGKITVTPLAGDKIVAKAEAVKDLDGAEFLLYVGRASPHKNLARLVDAFKILKIEHPQLKLVLVGKHDAVRGLIKNKVQLENINDVIFTGQVSDGQLRWLYEHCAAYIFPSLSEGFGLPGLEAMNHGAPVVSSDATCLPEVYGDAAEYFDPKDVYMMARSIEEVLTNKKLRDELVKKGQQRASSFSWQRTARQTLAVYEAVLAR